MNTWKSVPVNPTEEMIEAAFSHLAKGGGEHPIHIYQKMLAAAPSAPAQPTMTYEEHEQYIQAEIDRAPESLRRLGEYLGSVLDEDQWKAAERMLLGACFSRRASIDEKAAEWALALKGRANWDAQATEGTTRLMNEVADFLLSLAANKHD